jgi:hypothetical protein
MHLFKEAGFPTSFPKNESDSLIKETFLQFVA